MIERIAATLRPLPHVDPAAKARLLVAVAAERERDRRIPSLVTPDGDTAMRVGRRAAWGSAVAGAAAAVLAIVFWHRAPDATPTPAPAIAAVSAAAPTMAPAN
ncbi:MAG: hypothetical protein H0W68_14565, partial [Gemmatimonadaceae bacterium]|nr:hypothetical protein [Gemmatimonadaceae bacterium]